jgi:hypothetical protein
MNQNWFKIHQKNVTKVNIYIILMLYSMAQNTYVNKTEWLKM